MVKKATIPYWSEIDDFRPFIEMYNQGEQKIERQLWINTRSIMTTYRDGDDTIIVFNNGNAVRVKTPTNG